ncbi:MAG TPA: alanine--tRNA ligase [Gammaproteobacteria bacterium]|nr:alanine--tRNA ligase [Gammaproteobacteria bacterium]
MTTNDIRRTFLDFFSAHGHTAVPSSPLVPLNDPTLLFTNAGMVQFKDVFLGRDSRGYTRATSSQRCVRAGGKHNDLENVGYTARHHTFFEMLGNFSFGDYFKSEAIRLAWELLTKEFKLPPQRLWVTVYEDDDEAASIWLDEIGVDPKRFSRIGAKDNFWSMGDTGPCGPCSEIFYDHGEDVPGGPPGSDEAEGDRFVEIWNLVFMQFDRDADGNMTPLPKPCVDTGMGLERIAAVLQGVHSNYEIDLFRNLIEAAADVVGVKPDFENSSLRVIADHIRACAFLIVDGVLPANEGRGYVLRRIIRRAVRHGHKLGMEEPFLFRLVAAVEAEMGAAYPELKRGREQAEQVLLREEEQFEKTLAQGMGLLEDSLNKLRGKTIPGETVFKLYDTYGFPVDLTADIARERGLAIDEAGFEREMDAQRERARAASQFAGDYTRLDISAETTFTGYESLTGEGRVVALFRGDEAVETLQAGEKGVIVLDATPFYAESGGQVGDQGRLFAGDAAFRVDDTQKHGRAHAHIGIVEHGVFTVGQSIQAEVNAALRQATVLNHSATHLLHAALREELGEHVVQKGSLVAPDRLRFDFSHPQAVAADQLRRIESRVNAEIRRNSAAETRVMAYDEAIGSGAMALFGEKYGDKVRVLRLGEFSTELCGGTHVRRTGDIGLFKIVAETGIAAGIRRIEALTGERALEWVEHAEATLAAAAGAIKASPDSLVERASALSDRARRLEKEVADLKTQLASRQGGDLAERAVDVDGVKVVAVRLDGADARTLRDTADQLKNKLGSAAVVLAAVDDGKVRMVAGVTKDRTKAVPAGELINMVAEQVGGRGGGRADMAQAGGSNPAGLDAALQSVPDWIRQRLSGGAAR